MAIINRIHGSSLLTTSINVPIEFGVKTLNTEDTLILDDNFKIVIDENDVSSIIEFKTTPYVDYSKYDYERRRWFQVDTYNSLWRKYVKGDYILEENKIQTDDIVKFYSMENIYKNLFDCLTSVQDYGLDEIAELNFTSFKPVTLVIEGNVYEDITDYSLNISPKLDYIVPDRNHQFYVKGDRIYTNTDLTRYNIDDIDIKYFYNISDIKVHNIMNTNSASYSNYTPVVDYYMLKLTGQ